MAVPLVFLTYYNPILAFGLKAFCRTAVEAGVDGVIVADLPPEEAGPLRAEAEPAGLDVDPLRRADLDARAHAEDRAGQRRLHLPGVAHRGDRRAQPSCRPSSRQHLRALRGITTKPICVGFGIGTPGAGGRGRPARRRRRSSAPPSSRLVEQHDAGSADALVAEASATSSPVACKDAAARAVRDDRASGDASAPRRMARRGSGQARRREDGEERRPKKVDHRRGTLGQVRVLQGDRLPRRGGARRARLPQVPLPVPHHARASASRSLVRRGLVRGARGGAALAAIRSASRTPRSTRDRLKAAAQQDRSRGGGDHRHRRASAATRSSLARLRVRVPGRQHGLGGGREAHARHRAGHRRSACPLLIVSASGGARMQEGILSLMQMAKTSAALAAPGRRAAALHLAADRSDHRRRDGQLRHAGRRHPGRAARPHRLRRARASSRRRSASRCPRASSARSSCSSTASSTSSSSAASCGRPSAASSPSSPAAPPRPRHDVRGGRGPAPRACAAGRWRACARASSGSRRCSTRHRAIPSGRSRIVQVGGTNGKGSVSRHAGGDPPGRGPPRRASTPRPHLVDFRERIRVDGRPIPEADLVDGVEAHRHAGGPARRHHVRGGDRARARPLRPRGAWTSRCSRWGWAAGSTPRRWASPRSRWSTPHRLRPPGLSRRHAARPSPREKAAIIRSGVAFSAAPGARGEAVVVRRAARGRRAARSSRGATSRRRVRERHARRPAPGPARARAGGSTTCRAGCSASSSPATRCWPRRRRVTLGADEAAIRRGLAAVHAGPGRFQIVGAGARSSSWTAPTIRPAPAPWRARSRAYFPGAGRSPS